MLELTVSSKVPAAITGAFKKIKEMVTSGAVSKTTPVHIILEAGTYRESPRYNLSNPMVIEFRGKATDCIVTAENCESFHKGIENRVIFGLGPNVTSITMKNFSIINSHNKSITDGNTLPDSAEALFWNNTTGTLICEGMHIESRQNTLALKGVSEFINCSISGDIDFIYGDVDTAYFEKCRIFAREDNRGDYNAFVIKTDVFANKKGFIFSECEFSGDKRKRGNIFLCRTMGRGSATSLKGWDSVALVNCTVADFYNDELLWDDDMSLNVYPRGNARSGFREYKTKVFDKDGNLTEADTCRRNIKAYSLTEDDYNELYATRNLMVKGTPFEVSEEAAVEEQSAETAVVNA